MNPSEEQFARNFIVADKKERYLTVLESARGRKKVLAGFHHCRDVGSQFADQVTAVVLRTIPGLGG